MLTSLKSTKTESGPDHLRQASFETIPASFRVRFKGGCSMKKREFLALYKLMCQLAHQAGYDTPMFSFANLDGLSPKDTTTPWRGVFFLGLQVQGVKETTPEKTVLANYQKYMKWVDEWHRQHDLDEVSDMEGEVVDEEYYDEVWYELLTAVAEVLGVQISELPLEVAQLISDIVGATVYNFTDDVVRSSTRKGYELAKLLREEGESPPDDVDSEGA
jgi:hypothetical protein